MFEAMLRQVLYPAPPFPVPSPPPSPIENVPLRRDGQALSAWLHPLRDGRRPRLAALYLHGNGENLETIRLGGLFDELERLGAPCMAVDYPSYGHSEGTPDQASLTDSGVIAWDALGYAYPGVPRLLMGWSLGAAVASQVAAQRPGEAAAVALLSPWDDLKSLAKVHFSSFLVAVVKEAYDSRQAMADVTCPTLVVHGEHDDIIPVAHGRRLYEALHAEARFVGLPAVGHNDLLGRSEVWQALADLIEEVAP